jgi:hypothetical protein
MGILEGNQSVSGNKWEEIKEEGPAAVKRWIDNQMKGKSIVVVLIGAKTSQRKYVKYEIEKGWNDGKGVLGVYIHNLKNLAGEQSSKGSNPFSSFTVNGTTLSSIVKAYDPPYTTSKRVYEHIDDNLSDWVEKAIKIRNSYG